MKSGFSISLAGKIPRPIQFDLTLTLSVMEFWRDLILREVVRAQSLQRAGVLGLTGLPFVGPIKLNRRFPSNDE